MQIGSINSGINQQSCKGYISFRVNKMTSDQVFSKLGADNLKKAESQGDYKGGLIEYCKDFVQKPPVAKYTECGFDFHHNDLDLPIEQRKERKGEKMLITLLEKAGIPFKHEKY